MTNPHDIIIRPIITETSMEEMENKKYTFVVAKKPIRLKLNRLLKKSSM